MEKNLDIGALLKVIKKLHDESKISLVSVDEINKRYIEYYKSDENLIYKLGVLKDKLDDTIYNIEKNLTDELGKILISKLEDSIYDIEEIIHCKNYKK